MIRFRRLFRLSGREPSPEEDIAQEFEAHLQLKADALARTGLSPEEARREAERRFGPRERFAAECRVIDRAEQDERRRRERWAGAVQDLRLAVRGLLRAPAFALTAVGVLALGIGLNTAIFAALQGVVLRPLGFPQPEQLVAIHASNPQAGWPVFSVSPTDFLDYARESRRFQSLVAWSDNDVAATGLGPAEQVHLISVTGGFRGVTGVAPLIGRSFAPAEFVLGSPRVALLSYAAWSGRFGRERGILGKTWTLDGERYEIIGVMPPGFEFPVGAADAWAPFRMPEDVASQRGAHYLEVAGRLANDATLDAARAELITIASRIEKEFPQSSAGWSVLLRPMHDEVVRDARPTLLLLMTGAALLLLLACANVANLLTVRAVGKRGETAVRAALGAGQGRLLWHAASEVLVLIAAGTALAIPLAMGGVRLIRQLAPPGVPRLEAVHLDAVTLAFTLAVTAFTALLVGMAPVRRLAHSELRTELSAGARSIGSGRALQRGLVGVETALALALLAVAGVLLKSKQRLERVTPGFDPAATLVADVSLPDRVYPSGDAIVGFQRTLLERLRAVPGIESSALVFGLPLTGFGFSSSFTIDSVPVPNGKSQSAQLRAASSEYFRVQGIPLLQGRGFTAADRRGGKRVVLVSAAAVRRFWPDGKVLGHWIRMAARPGDDRAEGEIVGVVGDVRENGLDQPARPIVYYPTEQLGVGYFTLALRTRVAPQAQARALQQTVAALDPGLPVSRVRTMTEVVRDATAAARFRAWLMGVFALLATALGGLGIYAVLSHVVAQRTREIGLRRALGASDHQVVAQVVRSGMRDAALGAAAGLLGGWFMTRQLGKLLFEVKPGDPLVLILSALLFLGIAWLACVVPARRAIHADPVSVLRGE